MTQLLPHTKRKPYHPVVINILKERSARAVLDAPCGHGWLGNEARLLKETLDSVQAKRVKEREMLEAYRRAATSGRAVE